MKEMNLFYSQTRGAFLSWKWPSGIRRNMGCRLFLKKEGATATEWLLKLFIDKFIYIYIWFCVYFFKKKKFDLYLQANISLSLWKRKLLLRSNLTPFCEHNSQILGVAEARRMIVAFAKQLKQLVLSFMGFYAKILEFLRV